MKDHNHEAIRPIGIIVDAHLCLKCKHGLVINEVEILNIAHDFGAFCDNDKCERYLLLVV